MNPKILLTNDDGINAEGLYSLFCYLKNNYDVTIVAPNSEKSGVGHSVSLTNEIAFQTVQRNGKLYGYSLEANPADCVKFAITKIMKDDPPDIIVSGINPAMNAGNCVLYSGTVAAAIEGAMFSIPSIAVSMGIKNTKDVSHIYYDTASEFVEKLILIILKKKLPEATILNINVPNMPTDDLEGVAISKQGKSMFIDVFEEQDGFGEIIAYKNIGKEMIHTQKDMNCEFDDGVLYNKKISITPLQYDLTHHHFMEELRKWVEDTDVADISKELSELSKGIGADLE